MGQLNFERHFGFYSGVIVDTITPEYYGSATGVRLLHFDIYGSWLTNLPSDAVGWLSANNLDPTSGIAQGWRVRLVEQSFWHAAFEWNVEFSPRNFLGCITSRDGSVVYWVNNTRPLP